MTIYATSFPVTLTYEGLRKEGHPPNHTQKYQTYSKTLCAEFLFQLSCRAVTATLMPGLPLATAQLGLQQLVGRKKCHRFCRACFYCWNTAPSFPACHKLASYAAVKPKYMYYWTNRTCTEIFFINSVIFTSDSGLLHCPSFKIHSSTTWDGQTSGKKRWCEHSFLVWERRAHANLHRLWYSRERWETHVSISSCWQYRANKKHFWGGGRFGQQEAPFKISKAVIMYTQNTTSI